MPVEVDASFPRSELPALFRLVSVTTSPLRRAKSYLFSPFQDALRLLSPLSLFPESCFLRDPFF